MKRELQVAEKRLRHKSIVGTVAKGRSGLRYYPSIQIPKASSKEYQYLLQREVRAGMEEVRLNTIVSLNQYGALTKWENVIQLEITWADFWRPDMNSIPFLVQAVYDTLPSPANLHILVNSETPSAP